jgi:hypothetical protein
MMALTSGALKTCVRALETCEPSYIGRLARVFFMLEVRGPQGTAGRVVAPEPSWQGGRVQSCRARSGTGALPNSEEGSEAMVHVAAPEPSLAGRRGPDTLNTWQLRSPPWQGGRVRYCRARGCTPRSLS